LAALDGVALIEPAGAFYAFPRISDVEDSAALATSILRHTGVALAPGSAFGPGGEGHLRLCFAASEPTLREALLRLRDGWGQPQVGSVLQV
jgi:aspartate/methionine/tyrosine aminotransferase